MTRRTEHRNLRLLDSERLDAMERALMNRLAPLPGLDAASTASSRPESIGRYRITRLLGQGASGRVFAASDENLGRTVAIKLIAASTPEIRRRVQREARGLASLSHPNVVEVFEVGDVDGLPYIVMRFVDGVTLAERQFGTVADALEAYGQAAAGLAAMHDAGLVHRDFKPRNAVIDGTGRVLLIDFGLVRELESAPRRGPVDTEPIPNALPAVDPCITTSGTLLGTPAYMAPEQLLGGVATAQSDQFAWCVAVWEELFGARPWAGHDAPSLLAAMVAPPRPPDARHATVDAATIATLRRGLSVPPDERFPTMHDLLLALRPRRRPWLSVAALTGAVSLAVAIGAGSVDGPSTSTATRPAADTHHEAGRPHDDGIARAMAAVDAADLESAQSTVQEARTHVEALHDPERIARVSGVQAWVMWHSGLIDEAWSLADASYGALGSDDSAVRAVVALILADRAAADNDHDAAERWLRSADRERERNDASIQVAVLQGLARLAADRGEPEVGSALLDRAEALVRGRPVALGRLLAVRARIEETRQGLPAATAIADRARSIMRAQLGKRHPWTLQAELRWADFAILGGDFEGCHAASAATLAIAETLSMPPHVFVAPALERMAWCELHLGQSSAALEHQRRVQAIVDASFEPGHPRVAKSARSLAHIATTAGMLDEGLRHASRALVAAESRDGERDPGIAAALLVRAAVYSKRGEFGHALIDARLAEAILLRLAPTSLDAMLAEQAVARALDGLGDRTAALGMYCHVTEVLSAELGPLHPRLAAPLRRTGELLIADDRLPEAIEPLSRALRIEESHAVEPAARSVTRLLLGYALWSDPDRRAEAVATVRRAAAELSELDDQQGATAEARAWLAAHPAPT